MFLSLALSPISALSSGRVAVAVHGRYDLPLPNVILVGLVCVVGLLLGDGSRVIWVSVSATAESLFCDGASSDTCCVIRI